MIASLDADEFAATGSWDRTAFQTRIEKYESVSEPIARMAGILGRWGDDSELSIVLNILRSVSRHAESVGSGLSVFLNVRAYPAILVFTAYGLGLTRSERWETLHRLFSASMLRENREPVRVVEYLFLWSWKGGSDEVWHQIEGLDRHHTPLSDHLLALFGEWAKSFAGLSPDFELMFERFEMLGSLAHFENRESADVQAELTSGPGWASIPVGRASWRSSSAAKLLPELRSDPTKTAILEAGFAKGSADFLELFVKYFHRARSQFR